MVFLPEPAAQRQPLVLAPDTAPCPRCGRLCSRHERVVMHRMAGVLEGPAHKETAVVGAYLCQDCPPGKRWFRLPVPGFDPKQRYTPATKRALLALVHTYNLSFLAAADFGRTCLRLEQLHHSTLERWFLEAAADLDYQAHLQQALCCFSGQLAVDELYDGRYHVIKVTDPVNNVEITSWLGVGSPDADDIRALFGELREAGFVPELVVTDGSTLYPAPIAELWPDAEHQLCVFHFLQGALVTLTKSFWSSYKTMPAPPKRKRGRPKKRGRPRKDSLKRKHQETVRSVRYLVFKRQGQDERGRELLTEAERVLLDEALSLCPALQVVRRFVVDLYELFSPSTGSAAEAQQHRDAMLKDPAYHKDAAMARVLARLADEGQWQRLIRYHDFDNAQKTSNHVERANREHRRRQRSHYRLRSLRALWALLNLTLMSQPMPSRPIRLTRRRPVDQETQEVKAA